MLALFNTLFYQPLLNALVFLYTTIAGEDLGIAIIVLTILIRLLLLPLSKSAIVAQQQMQKIQPRVEEIKLKHKGDKPAQTQAIMDLYKAEKVNPAGSCLPLLIQLPIFIALYKVLGASVASEHLDLLYSFIQNPGVISHISFGFLDLSQRNVIIALCAGAAQYWQSSQTPIPKSTDANGQKDESFATALNKQMRYTMPLMTLFISATLPAGLSLYWLVSTLSYAIQQHFLMKPPKLAS